MSIAQAPQVSVIVGTRNGARRLPALLAGLKGQGVDSPSWELIVVDNASSDETSTVVTKFWGASASVPLRLLKCPVPGASRARNAGLAAAQGQVLLFVDDDIRVGSGWIRDLSAPILQGRCHAAVGLVVIPDSLKPDWLLGDWPGYFASTEHYSGTVFDAVTACLGVARSVFKTVRGFDPELGGGGLGYYEDILFGLQLRAAGFGLRFEPAARVEHHLDPQRFGAAELRRFARQHGVSRAYLDFHWRHADADSAWRHLLGWWKDRMRAQLIPDRKDSPRSPISRAERSRLMNTAYWWTMTRLSGKPRHYDLCGLTKLRGVLE